MNSIFHKLRINQSLNFSNKTKDKHLFETEKYFKSGQERKSYSMMNITLIVCLSLILFSCKKSEIRPYFGTYSVTGGTISAPSMQYIEVNYEVRFRNRIDGKIEIINLAKYGGKLNAKVDGSSFTVTSDKFKPSTGILEGLSNIEGSGYFYAEDSVYFDLYYTGPYGDPTSFHCKGVKL